MHFTQSFYCGIRARLYFANVNTIDLISLGQIQLGAVNATRACDQLSDRFNVASKLAVTKVTQVPAAATRQVNSDYTVTVKAVCPLCYSVKNPEFEFSGRGVFIARRSVYEIERSHRELRHSHFFGFQHRICVWIDPLNKAAYIIRRWKQARHP